MRQILLKKPSRTFAPRQLSDLVLSAWHTCVATSHGSGSVGFPAKVRRFVNTAAGGLETAAPCRTVAKNAHDSARGVERVCVRGFKVEHMKTAAQRIQTADTIELVPQILHLKRILVP